jgi:hypothetical protein
MSQHAFSIFVTVDEIVRVDIPGDQNELIQHPIRAGRDPVVGVVQRLAQHISAHRMTKGVDRNAAVFRLRG